MNQSISRALREEDAAQHEPEAALRVRFGVRERERRAPRAAEHQPAVDVEVRAQTLEVGDEGLRRVAFELGDGRRAAGAALVDEHDAPERRIEVAAVMRQAAAAGAAVQEHDGHAVGAAASSPNRAYAASRPRGVR